jgi:hypothetical protein
MRTEESGMLYEVHDLVARGKALQAELDVIEAELALVEDPDQAFELLERAKSIPTRIRALEISLANKERRERETNTRLY